MSINTADDESDADEEDWVPTFNNRAAGYVSAIRYAHTRSTTYTLPIPIWDRQFDCFVPGDHHDDAAYFSNHLSHEP
jgi:hypothetical protein